MLDIEPELDWQFGTRALVYLIKAEDFAAGTESSYTFPLRPFEAHVLYRTRDGGYWRLDSVVIKGRRVRRNGTVNPDAAPHATHYSPGSPFYDAHAPQWLRDFVESHRTPPPLAQPV